MSSIASTSAASRARHGVPASRCFTSVRRSATSPRRMSRSTQSKIGQRRDELFRREQAHVLVQHRPAHFERGHEVVIDQQRVGRRGCSTTGVLANCVARRARPSRGPVLEPQVADARGRIGRFLWRERSRLDGASGEQRVREERELTTAREVGGLVVSRTYAISRRKCASLAACGSASAASSSARGRSGITPASARSSMTASSDSGTSLESRRCGRQRLGRSAVEVRRRRSLGPTTPVLRPPLESRP